MESIITAAMVLGMYFNTVNGNEVNNLYDAEAENHVECRYDYDAEGRLSSKETMRWDEATKQWVENVRLCYKYYKNGYNVEVSKWNKEKKTYDLPTEVTLYRSAGPNLTSVRTYRMNDQKDMMYLISKKVIPRSRINHG